jgi:BirA family biotin operon repressor/biotin-[acetyl-CoA-carboxylase] ligase
MAPVTVDGIPAAVLARRWGVPACAAFESLPSVLDVIHELGAQQAAAGTVVLANEQTAGRGRDGRTWRSPLGGVWLAMLVRPPFPDAGLLSLRAGLVVADVIDELLGRAQAALKWPNDVLLDGRKLAGILCEARWQGDVPQWLALGIGINVANEIPPEIAQQAIALHELLPCVRRVDVLDRLIPGLRPIAAHRSPLTESERDAFKRRDWLRGRRIRAPLVGRAAGIRPDGALVVETDAGPRVVREGHVELAPQSPSPSPNP